MIYSKSRKKGFGLIEVLLSGTILSMILGSIVMLGNTSQQARDVALERVQAAYLIQSELEIAHQVRDTNWTDGNNSSTWDSVKYSTDNSYQSINSILSVGGTVSGDYSFDETDKIYEFTPGARTQVTLGNTIFNSEIKYMSSGNLIESNISSGKALKAEATISWTSVDGTSKTMTGSTIITDWRPKY